MNTSRLYDLIGVVLSTFDSRLIKGVETKEVIERIHIFDSRYSVYTIWKNLVHYISENYKSYEFISKQNNDSYIEIKGKLKFIGFDVSYIAKTSL